MDGAVVATLAPKVTEGRRVVRVEGTGDELGRVSSLRVSLVVVLNPPRPSG